MTEFSYIAISRTGEKVSGRADAVSREIVLQQLRSMGQLPVEVRQYTSDETGEVADGTGLFNRGPSKAQITLFTRELAMLIEAGLPLDNALKLLADGATTSGMSSLIRNLRSSINEGKSFHQALARHGKLFPPSYVNMIRVAEVGGTLDTVLTRIASAREREQKLKSKIASALIYPGFLIFTAFGAIALMLGFVVPRFKEMITTSGGKVPEGAQLVMAASDWLIANALNLVISTAGLLFVLMLALRQIAFRKAFQRSLLQLPLIGQLYRLNLTIRFCRNLGTLLENGVDLPEALRLSQGVLADASAAEVIEKANECLRKGEDFTTPLAASNLFPPVAVNLLQVGMETGSIAPSALHLANMFEEKLEIAVQRTFTILEPLIIVLVSALVAGIIISIIGAVISVNEIVL